MDAVRPRQAAPGERLGDPRRRRALIVTAVLALALDAVLWGCQRGTFGTLPTAYWLMGALAVVVDPRPDVVATPRSSSVILPSICFTFAIALAWGFGPALAVQTIAVTVAGVRLRHPVR